MVTRKREATPGVHSRRGLTSAVLAGLLLAVAALLVAGEPPAAAIVVRLHGHGYGVAPISVARGEALARARPQLAGAAPSPGGAAAVRPFDQAPGGGKPLTWQGGPVMHSNTTRVVYWDPNKEFTSTTKAVIASYVSDVASDSGLASNVYGVDAQFTDATGNAAYKSSTVTALVDEHAYPTTGNCTTPSEPAADKGPPYTTCLFDSQLQSELHALVVEKGLPTGLTQLYLILTPHKVVSCFNETKKEEAEFGKICSNNFFCAYHSAAEAGSGHPIIYADIPFSLLDSGFAKSCQDDGHAKIQLPNGDGEGTNSATRYADVALKYLSHEFSEAITDPLPEFATAWVDSNGLENGDKCNGVSPDLEEDGIGYDKNSFTPTLGGSVTEGTLFNQEIAGGHFYTQSEWDNAAKACRMEPLPLSGASFSSSPATPSEGATVSFQASVSDPYGAPEFSWDFGDGTTGTGEAPGHTYTSAGEFTVTMTARDRLTGSTATPVVRALVAHVPPEAAFTHEPEPALANTLVKFNASGSRDPDGTISGYEWDFGDGSGGAGPEPAHEYATAGTYTVTLKVTDNSGLSSEARQPVSVVVAPGHSVISVASPNSGFSGTASFNAKSGTITVSLTVADAGIFKWLARFSNGRYGVLASRATKCIVGQIQRGRCRPPRLTFGSGSKAVSGAGPVTFTIKPTAAGVRALKRAAKRGRGVAVKLAITFQSDLGGAPVTHRSVITVKLKH
jgi:PKD repeat protein